MILAFLFIAAAYAVSKLTPPPHHETWEEIQTKINQK